MKCINRNKLFNRYSLTGKSVKEVCEKNAQLAMSAKRPQVFELILLFANVICLLRSNT